MRLTAEQVVEMSRRVLMQEHPDMALADLCADWLEQDAELAVLRKVVEAVRVWYESDPRTLTVKQLYAIGDALDAYDALKGGQR